MALSGRASESSIVKACRFDEDWFSELMTQSQLSRCEEAERIELKGISMSKPQDRTVYRRDDGQWVNKRNDATLASSLHDTQAEANAAAKDMLQNQGGGERTTLGRDGRIVSKDTIAPGNDPNPPRDHEH